jgi:hypothetical protein
MMNMSFELLQVQRMECSLCKQPMYHDDLDCERVMMLLCGAKKYSVCPNCLQEVKEENWTRSYKCRWTRKVKKIQNEQS